MVRSTLVAVASAAVVVAGDDSCCWCDPATPAEATTFTDSLKRTNKLVFSDEFSTKGRNFANGHDTKWTALEIGDTANMGAAFYLPEQATIVNDPLFPDVSALQILTENVSHVGNSPTGEKNIHMPYKSAMLQSWNKFCFTSGVIEFKARQPRGAGYWPALWTFGNLGRAVYQNSNTGLWPWSYNQCDPDLELPPGDPPQRISACDDQDPDSGLLPFQGRGATELDVLEGAVTNTGLNSYGVGSLQLSPGIPSYFKPPLFGFPTISGPGQWYNGLDFGPPVPGLASGGFANNGWYGPPWGSDCPTGCPDALSGGFVELDDLDTRYWTYRMEWQAGPDGHLAWYYDGNFVWSMSAESFGEYSVCTDRGGEKECTRTPKRQIPEEPMSIVMNTAIGTWNGGRSALDGKHWPAKFFVDYVRVWQSVENIGCDPPNYPTKAYIDAHAEWYGEPADPPGEATCKPKYPASTYAHAAAIKAAAVEVRAGRADFSPAAVLLAQAKKQGTAQKAASHVGDVTPHLNMNRGEAVHRALNPSAYVQTAAATPAISTNGDSSHAESTLTSLLMGKAPQPTEPAATSSPSTASSPSPADSSAGSILSSLGLVAVGALVSAVGMSIHSRRNAAWPRAGEVEVAEDDLRSSYQAYASLEGRR